MNKKEIIHTLIGKIEEEKQRLEKTSKEALKAAIDAPGAMQSHHDTYKFEYGQLVTALGTMSDKTEVLLGHLKEIDSCEDRVEGAISIGSLVKVQNLTQPDSNPYWNLILLGGGGLTFEYEGEKIIVVTPESPIGKSLTNSAVTEIVEVNTPKGTQKFEILEVK